MNLRRLDSEGAEALRAVTPGFCHYTDALLFDEIWERPGLSKRDRSLITVAALVALYRPDELGTHLGLALDNGVTREELAETLTHLAFYAAWPSANSAAYKLMEVLQARDSAAAGAL